MSLRKPKKHHRPSRLKKWLIAHEGNDHLPHLLRLKGISAGVVLVLVVQVVFNFAAIGQFKVLGYASDINAPDLLYLTNSERTSRGLHTLQSNSQLNSAARAKAQHMFTHDYWAHVAPDGTQPWYFISQAGYGYSYAGENLAKGFNTSQGVISGWMGSSAHRDNLLDSSWQDVGFAVMNGTLQGSETTLVVALFATPVAPPPPPPPPNVAAHTEQFVPPALVDEPEPDPEPEPEPEPEIESEDLSHLAGLDLTPKNQEFALAGEVNYGPTRLLPISRTLSWGEGATAFILSGFLFANTMNHTIVWRKRHTRLERAKHIWFRTHPAIQATILTLPLLVMILSGLGTVL